LRLPGNKLSRVILPIILLAATIKVPFFSNSSASTETVVKVEPSSIELGNRTGDPIPIPGTQFTVAIKIYNVTNLYGFDLKFRWNTTFLAYVNHSVCVPKDAYPDGVLWKPVMPIKDEVDAATGTYWIAYASMGAPSFNGTGTVFTMTFQVINQPYDYETGGPTVDPIDTLLDFISTDLAEYLSGVPILHNVEPAIVRIWEKRSELPAEPILKVEPAEVENLPKCETFDINTWIISVDSQYDIQSFNITLNFNSTLIEATGITEGPWPRNYANNTMEILKQINNSTGTATYAVELIPPRKLDPPTTGILFTVTFHVIYESSTYPPPTCEIKLGPTEILDRNVGSISHITENGTYTAFRPPPIAKFAWTPSGNVLPRGQTITFDASESYHPLGIKLYAWDFGDGNKTTIETPIITHIYKATGTVTVILNVTDRGNFWAVTSVTLYIIDEPQTPSAISVVNPLIENTDFKFYTNTTSVGSHFNITIHVYNVADLQAYQIHLEYNPTFLNATRVWLPAWDTNWVFYNKTTIRPQPKFGSNYVRIGDAIQGNYPTFSGEGILCVIEFEILFAPTTGEISCSLNVNNTDTLLLDSNRNEISSIKTNGHYTYIYEKLSSTISITISPSTIDFGENTTISGVIFPLRLANVTLLYSFQETEWKNLTIVPTNLEGRYAHTWMPPKAGNYTIRASWPGDENTNPAENETRLTVAKLNSSITISVNPENITLGSSVIINGTLSPARANANITIQYQLQGQTTWNFITAKLTDNNGNFSHVWMPPKAGNYTIRASWLGDQNTHQAESEHKTVKVEPQPTEMVLYIVTGIITVAIIVAAAIYLVKIRKPK
jgi:hypothetical protein